MKALLATHSLAHAGGSETYLLTAALALQRLGHEVGVFTLEPGEMSELAGSSGLRVAASEHQLDDGYDAIVVQDGATSYALAERFPSVRQLFVAHTADYALQYPPQLTDAVGAIVALNDRVGRRLEGLAHCPQLIRLRQPIDTRRFVPASPLPPRPTSLTVLSNYLQGERLEIVKRAARDLGMSLTVLGGAEGGESTLSPEERLSRSDVVLGCGRSALEAMACGRAVYVFGHLGVDGWVTPETYTALEEDGFAGLGSKHVADADELRTDLANYEAAMGLANQSLAVRHHDAGAHAAELVAALRSLTRENRAPERERVTAGDVAAGQGRVADGGEGPQHGAPAAGGRTGTNRCPARARAGPRGVREGRLRAPVPAGPGPRQAARLPAQAPRPLKSSGAGQGAGAR